MYWSRPGPRTSSSKMGAACQGEGRPNEDRSNPSHGSGPTCRGLAAVDRTDRGDHSAYYRTHAGGETGAGSNDPLPSSQQPAALHHRPILNQTITPLSSSPTTSPSFLLSNVSQPSLPHLTSRTSSTQPPDSFQQALKRSVAPRP